MRYGTKNRNFSDKSILFIQVHWSVCLVVNKKIRLNTHHQNIFHSNRSIDEMLAFNHIAQSIKSKSVNDLVIFFLLPMLVHIALLLLWWKNYTWIVHLQIHEMPSVFFLVHSLAEGTFQNKWWLNSRVYCVCHVQSLFVTVVVSTFFSLFFLSPLHSTKEIQNVDTFKYTETKNAMNINGKIWWLWQLAIREKKNYHWKGVLRMFSRQPKMTVMHKCNASFT